MSSEIPKDTQDLIDQCTDLITYISINACIGEKREEELKEKLAKKNIEGFKKYGEFKFEDNNMYQMAEEEILDAINYSCYELIKLDRLNGDDKLIKSVRILVADLMDIYDDIQDIRTTVTEKLDKHFNS